MVRRRATVSARRMVSAAEWVVDDLLTIISFILDPRFLEGRCAEVLLTPTNKVVGVMGVLHPEVITNFDLSLPASALEMSIERIYY